MAQVDPSWENSKMNAEYQVCADELKQVLKTLGKFRKGKFVIGDAIFEFLSDSIDITFNGMSMSVDAQGEGKGKLKIKSGAIRFLSSIPCKEETVKVWVKEGSLHIEGLSVNKDGSLHKGTRSVDCEWMDISPGVIELPMDPPLGLILSLPFMYTKEEVASSGYSSVVEKAEEQLDSIFSRTSKALYPLGINEKELHEFIYASLKKRYAPDAPTNH